MVKSVTLRSSNPLVVQTLWSAIEFIRAQKQIPNWDRISRYMARETELPEEECKKELNLAVKDDLVVEYTCVGFKGAKVGVEQEGYKVPEFGKDFTKGSHDWYCYACHKPGDILPCSDCWRVYHPKCTQEDTSGTRFVCDSCKVLTKQTKFKRKKLNTLLRYTCLRLKDKTKELHKFGITKDEPVNRRLLRFVYAFMDLDTMETKCHRNSYTYLEQFQADAAILYHNTVICYGHTGPMSELAEIMIKDCRYDTDEISLCKECYYFSNAKPKDWFCQPCKPPHELVYAKQKGFSHWPGKVIKKTEEDYDVRFFGGFHQRAVISKNYVKPIDTDMKDLQIKKTPAFVKAQQELARHKELMEKFRASLEKEGDKTSSESEIEDIPPSDIEEFGSLQDKYEEEEDYIPTKVAKKPKKKETPKRVKVKTPVKTKKRSISKKKYAETDDEEEEEIVPVKKKRKFKASDLKPQQLTRKSMGAVEADMEREAEPATAKKQKRKSAPPVVEESKPKVKKSKKKQEETGEGVTSSSNVISEPQAPSPENADYVTSTQNFSPRSLSTVTTGTQTSKKLTAPGKQPHKATQTDAEITPAKCECDSHYTQIFSDFKERFLSDHKNDKDKAIKEVKDQLQREFEVDKQQAVQRAMGSQQKEVDRIRQKTEDTCRTQYMEEMKKLAQKHKTEISATKKKQWCYNCEEEAMYHCCWNTSYCSIKCQQEHWHKEHKRMCRLPARRGR